MLLTVLRAFNEGPPPEFTSVIDHYASGTMDPTAIWWEQLSAPMFMALISVREYFRRTSTLQKLPWLKINKPSFCEALRVFGGDGQPR